MTTRGGVTRSPATNDAAPTDEALEAELRTLRRLNERLVEELRAAEAVRDEYIDLYELAPIPALTLDAAYVTRRMNRAMNELLGVARDQCMGESFRSFVFAEDRKLLSEHLARVPYEPAARCCLRLVSSSGAPIPVELWTNALARTGLFQLRVVDLREERLSDLEASRLVASERSARSANAAKDTFIAMLSHELRTPLTPALALASHFRDSHPSRDVRRAFGIVERNLLAEVRMIDDLLDVNRVVRGKMAVNCRPAAVHDIVREAAQPLLPVAESKYQIVEFELRAEREHANVDGLRLRQVFGNLIRNASKFCPSSS